jgi:hypothetical protein
LNFIISDDQQTARGRGRGLLRFVSLEQRQRFGVQQWNKAVDQEIAEIKIAVIILFILTVNILKFAAKITTFLINSNLNIL